MYEIDFISTYFPNEEELTDELLQSTRARVVGFLHTHHPDVDTRPGSVVGDLMVGPMVSWLASSELTMGKIMSDLDLGNVAKGIIYNCDYVERYLGNFSVYDTKPLPSGGLLRLVLSEDKIYSLNKEMKFTFGNGDIFSLRVEDDLSDVKLLPSGSLSRYGKSEYVLVQTGINSWSVDLPVVGTMTGTVIEGASGEITKKHLFDELIGISAAVDFYNGLPQTGLSGLATVARQTFQSAGMQSRGSIESHVKHHWPETLGTSAVVSGDVEMQRDTVGSPLMLPIPTVDLYVKSIHDMKAMSQVVRLKWDATEEVFRGDLRLLHRPSLLRNIIASGNSDVVIESYDLYTQAIPGMMGITSSGSVEEKLWIVIRPPKDSDGNVQVPRVLEGTDSVGYFEVSYICDPLLEAYSSELSGENTKSIGVSNLVKSGPIVDIHSMTISYRKQPGVICDVHHADDEIARGIRDTFWPKEFSEAPVIDAMYKAGADRVVSIDYAGTICVTPATHILHNGVVFDNEDVVSLQVKSSPTPRYTVDSIADMTETRVGNDVVDVATTTMSTHACSSRNLRYFIEAENIRTIEI